MRRSRREEPHKTPRTGRWRAAYGPSKSRGYAYVDGERERAGRRLGAVGEALEGLDSANIIGLSFAQMPKDVGEGEDQLAIVVDERAAPLAPRGRGDAQSLAAVRQYVHEQLSPRSRQNALDALRRVARVALADPGARAEDFPWLDLTEEVAQLVRRLLHDQTVAGAIVPGTANITLSHLRGMARKLYRMRLIDHERFTSIAGPGMLKNVPGKRRTRGKELSAAGERELRQAARALDGYQGAMLDAAIVLAIGGGLRREEVANIELERVGPGEITLIGKGNKEREVPVDAQMQAAIDDWGRERARLQPEHGRLFCSPWHPSRVLSPWSFWSLVRQAAHGAFGDRQPCAPECACFEALTGPHDFRRTFITRLLDQGFDLRQAQLLAGHESPETTARYDKRSIRALFDKRRGVRVLAT